MTESRRIVGDCRVVLRQMIEEGVKVQCCVTSPPYFGLRDYGTASWEGGDGSECKHVEMAVGMSDKNTLGRDGYLPPSNAANVGKVRQYRHTCAKCGARRVDKQIGLEANADCLGWATKNPCGECHVCVIVEVFRLVREVLADDGTCWINYGDCYASSGDRVHGGFNGSSPEPQRVKGHKMGAKMNLKGTGLKPKDLVGMPWRVALALQADGWYLRSDIIWAKPNPMPESCTDRPTKSHEYLFMLSKRANYFYDAEAVREGDHVYTRTGTKGGHKLTQMEGYKGIAGGTLKRDPEEPYGFARDITTVGRNKRSVWTISADDIVSQPAYRIREDISDEQLAKLLDEFCEPVEITTDRPVQAHEYLFLLTKSPRYFYDADAIRENLTAWEMRDGEMVNIKGGQGFAVTRHSEIYPGQPAMTGNMAPGKHITPNPAGRNRRTVWEIATEPFSEAHFATFPKALISPAILAGTSQRGHCPGCGARWVRVVEREFMPTQNPSFPKAGQKGMDSSNGWGDTPRGRTNAETTGWRDTCDCLMDPIPDIVLDPFGGSGTVGAVAEQLGRKWILIDLNPEYGEMQKRRTAQTGMAL